MLTLLLFLSTALAQPAPKAIGVDAVYCRASSDNPFAGYYALDYLAQYSGAKDSLTAKTLDEQFGRLEKLFSVKLPELATNWWLFRSNLFSNAPDRVYLWEAAPFGLRDIKDEDLVTLLPENCRDGDRIRAVQVLALISPQDTGLSHVVVKYVPDVIEQLERENPFQLSFLLTRLFLSTFNGTTTDQNRRLAFYLHTTRLEDWSRRQWNDAVTLLHFPLPMISPPFFVTSYCKDTDPVQERKLIASLQPNKILGFGVKAYGFEYERPNECPGGGECPFLDLRDYAEPVRKLHLKPAVRMMFADDALWVMSDSDGGHFTTPVRHLRCEVDKVSRRFGNCGEFTSQNGQVLKVPTSFKVTVGENCVKIQSAGIIKGKKTSRVFAMSFLLDL